MALEPEVCPHAPASEAPGLEPTATAVLSRLYVELFDSAAQMHVFVRSFAALEGVASHLPADTVSAEEMAFELVSRLEERKLVTRELFEVLVRERPRWAEEIRRVAEACGVGVELAREVRSPWPKRRRAVVGVSVAAVAAAALTIGGAIGRMVSTPEPKEVAVVPTAEVETGAGTPATLDDPLAIPDKLIVVVDPEPPHKDVGAANSDTVLSLGDNELDPIVLTVVSSETGKPRRVLLSRHRRAEAAARDYLVATWSDPATRSDLAKALDRDEFTICQLSECYSEEVVGDVIDASIPVKMMRRQPQWTDVSRDSLKTLPTPSGERRASDPFGVSGDWQELFASGDPWVTDVMRLLSGGAYPTPRKQDTAYQFELSVCPDGTIKPRKRVGTGERAVDEEIVAVLTGIRLADTRAILALLKGKCRPILHRFVLRWRSGRPRVE